MEYQKSILELYLTNPPMSIPDPIQDPQELTSDHQANFDKLMDYYRLLSAEVLKMHPSHPYYAHCDQMLDVIEILLNDLEKQLKVDTLTWLEKSLLDKLLALHDQIELAEDLLENKS